MWIKTLSSHYPLVNLASASCIGRRNSGPIMKWELTVINETGAVPIAYFDDEDQLNEAIEKIALKLKAASSIDDL